MTQKSKLKSLTEYAADFIDGKISYEQFVRQINNYPEIKKNQNVQPDNQITEEKSVGNIF